MNILYLSLSYLPSRRASSVHVMRMCSAIARAGHSVRLVAKRGLPHELDDFAFYGAARSFEITKLARPKLRGGGLVFAASVTRLLLSARKERKLIYSRDLLGAVNAAMFDMPFVFEAHGIPTQSALRFALHRVLASRSLQRLVVISDGLRQDLVAEGFDVPLNTVVAHDAADLPAHPPSLRAVGNRVRLGYVGNLYAGRGIELVFDLAKRVPECDVEVVGGTEADLARWRRVALPSNVVLAGFVPPALLEERYRRFDILLMPYSGSRVATASGSDTSRWMSPMKLFEYMAARTPIIASDLLVLREILEHEHTALFAAPDDVGDWERAVRRLIGDPALGAALAHRAYQQLVREHTWDARVEKVLAGLVDR